MSTKLRIIVLTVLVSSACAVCLADDRTATWTGAGGDSSWGKPTNWSPPVVPDNDATGDNWSCEITAVGHDAHVELERDRTVSSVTTNSGSETEVRLDSDGWRRSVLTLDYNGMTGTLWNEGRLDLGCIELCGTVVNRGAIDFDNTRVMGRFENRGGGRLTGEVEGLLVVGGDLINDGDIDLGLADVIAWGQVRNRGPIWLSWSVCAADHAELINEASGTIEGTGGLHSPVGIQNAGSIVAAGGDLGVHCRGPVTNTGTLTNTAGTGLHVTGTEVDHRGKIIANAGGGVTFTCDLTNKTGASIELLGGTLSSPTVTNKPGASFTGFGGVTGNLVNEGVIDLYGDTSVVGDVRNEAAATLGVRNGDLLVTGDTANHGTINVVNGKLFCEGSLTNTGTINIDPSLAVVVGDLTLAAEGVLVADAGSTLQMMGDFLNGSRRPGEFDLAAAAVQFRRTDGAIQEVEVAGEDRGPDDGGWSHNFAFGALLLGGTFPSSIRLVDDFDNQANGPDNEALYVGDLLLGAGAKIDPNGLKLYYRNGGDPKQFFHGDATLDGAVDVHDLAALANHYAVAGNWVWGDGDFTGDGSVDVFDLAILANNYGSTAGGGAQPIPEPATILIVTAAGLPMLLKRRRNA